MIGPETTIEIPASIEEVEFESELAVVIGKETTQVQEDEVLEHVFGYTIANDVTAPQYFHESGHWTLGKSFNTFTPIGPVIETNIDPHEVVVEAFHNAEKKRRIVRQT